MNKIITPTAAIIELNKLKTDSGVTGEERRNAAVDIAIKAINRCMVRRKPNSFYKDNQCGEFYREFYCPNCNRLVVTNYCGNCGQALDWR